MLRYLAALALLCAGAAPAPAPPSPWPLRTFVEWQPGWGSRTIEAAGVRFRVDPKRCGEDRPASEACDTGSRYVVATIDGRDAAPGIIDGTAGAANYIGVGKLGPGATRPALILVTDSGGSAGCAEIAIATVEQGAYRTTRLTDPAAAHSSFCEVDAHSLAWPSDLTAHGRAEFLLKDTGFHCLFTSCAGSWYPPRVIAFDGRKAIDVSADPALAPLFRRDMVNARTACERRIVEAQGACAGYAADAARLGLLNQAWPVVMAQVRRGCRVPVTGVCPDIYHFPRAFPAQLAAALRRSGYVGAGRKET